MHFLLSNYLTVLLRPGFESPVDNSADLIERDIIPFLTAGAQIWRDFFADSPDPNYQEISRRLIFAKDYAEYKDMVRKVISTGLYAQMNTLPWCFNPNNCTEEYKQWYRSSESISGNNPYEVHLSNKKWPLKKVSHLYENIL